MDRPNRDDPKSSFRVTLFRSKVPLVQDRGGEPIAPEWDLHCAKCGYELTGLTTRRCPECGESFNAHDLWLAQRYKKARFQVDVPAYVPYGGLAITLLLVWPVIFPKIWVIAPLAALPVYEWLASYHGWEKRGTRGILITFCVVLSAFLMSFD